MFEDENCFHYTSDNIQLSTQYWYKKSRVSAVKLRHHITSTLWLVFCHRLQLCHCLSFPPFLHRPPQMTVYKFTLQAAKS